jgi:hypothetical protein
VYKETSQVSLPMKGRSMSSGKTKTFQDSLASPLAPVRAGSADQLSKETRTVPAINLETMHPMQRARLDAAVMMLVDYLVSASAED